MKTPREHTKKAFREYLNTLNSPAVNPWRNGRYAQRTRLYGDYLYAQDREMFDFEYDAWLAKQRSVSSVEGV